MGPPAPKVTFAPETAEVQFDNILSLCEKSTNKFVGEEKADTVLKATKRIGPLLVELSDNLGKDKVFTYINRTVSLQNFIIFSFV